LGQRFLGARMIDRKYFKTEQDYERQKFMCAQIQTVMAEFVRYAIEIGVLNPVITETVTTAAEDKAVKRQHDQHRRCVAFDGRVFNWSGEQIDAMVAHLNEKFKALAYETNSGKHQVAFCHDSGNGDHFHVAVNARYKLPEFSNDRSV
jgi:hypothetical protein